MNCIVTAGPTYEPLDEVRRLTNFSTGRLGTELAAHLLEKGHTVTLLIGEQATWWGERRAAKVSVFTTTANLQEQLRALASESVNAVFHAAAVSDFSFGKIWSRSPSGEQTEIHAGKISTGQGTLTAELVPTPKILSGLRDVFPGALLVGWKYEVDGDLKRAVEQGRSQIKQARTDGCVINGPAYGKGFGLLKGDGNPTHFENFRELFAALEALLRA